MPGRPRPTGVVLILLCLMYGITYIDRVNVSTAAAVFGKELDLSNTQVGFVFSAFAYPYLLFQIIGGWVGDRFGARLALTVAGVIWSVGTLMTGLAGSLTIDDRRASGARVRRRRDVSGGDARDVGLDACRSGAASRRASRIRRRGSATPSRRRWWWR